MELNKISKYRQFKLPPAPNYQRDVIPERNQSFVKFGESPHSQSASNQDPDFSEQYINPQVQQPVANNTMVPPVQIYTVQFENTSQNSIHQQSAPTNQTIYHQYSTEPEQNGESSSVQYYDREHAVTVYENLELLEPKNRVSESTIEQDNRKSSSIIGKPLNVMVPNKIPKQRQFKLPPVSNYQNRLGSNHASTSTQITNYLQNTSIANSNFQSASDNEQLTSEVETGSLAHLQHVENQFSVFPLNGSYQVTSQQSPGGQMEHRPQSHADTLQNQDQMIIYQKSDSSTFASHSHQPPENMQVISPNLIRQNEDSGPTPSTMPENLTLSEPINLGFESTSGKKIGGKSSVTLNPNKNSKQRQFKLPPARNYPSNTVSYHLHCTTQPGDLPTLHNVLPVTDNGQSSLDITPKALSHFAAVVSQQLNFPQVDDDYATQKQVASRNSDVDFIGEDNILNPKSRADVTESNETSRYEQYENCFFSNFQSDVDSAHLHHGASPQSVSLFHEFFVTSEKEQCSSEVTGKSPPYFQPISIPLDNFHQVYVNEDIYQQAASSDRNPSFPNEHQDQMVELHSEKFEYSSHHQTIAHHQSTQRMQTDDNDFICENDDWTATRRADKIGSDRNHEYRQNDVTCASNYRNDAASIHPYNPVSTQARQHDMALLHNSNVSTNLQSNFPESDVNQNQHISFENQNRKIRDQESGSSFYTPTDREDMPKCNKITEYSNCELSRPPNYANGTSTSDPDETDISRSDPANSRQQHYTAHQHSVTTSTDLRSGSYNKELSPEVEHGASSNFEAISIQQADSPGSDVVQNHRWTLSNQVRGLPEQLENQDSTSAIEKLIFSKLWARFSRRKRVLIPCSLTDKVPLPTVNAVPDSFELQDPTDDSFDVVLSRTCTSEEGLRTYLVTAEEVNRRVNGVEKLNNSSLALTLRKPKSKSSGESIRKKMREKGIQIDLNSRQNVSPNKILAMSEAEGVHWAMDLDDIVKGSYPVDDIVNEIVREAMIDKSVDLNSLMDVEAISQCMASLGNVLTSVIPPITGILPKASYNMNLNLEMEVFSEATHGLGIVTQPTWVRALTEIGKGVTTLIREELEKKAKEPDYSEFDYFEN